MATQPSCLVTAPGWARLLLQTGMTTAAKKRSSAEVQTAAATGRVVRSVRTESRLPHERDESTRQPATPPARVMKQAHDDVRAGRVDTDTRGDNARRAFERSMPVRGSKSATPSQRRKPPSS